MCSAGGGADRLSAGQVQRLRCLLVEELVEEADVGEGSSGHDRVVTTPRAVRVVVPGTHAAKARRLATQKARPCPAHSPPAGQVARCGAAPRDVPGGRDVVGGDGVPQVQQHVGVQDGRGGPELLGLGRREKRQSRSCWGGMALRKWATHQPLEEGRRLDVGGLGVPAVERVRRGHQGVPALVYLLWGQDRVVSLPGGRGLAFPPPLQEASPQSSGRPPGT